ncbi:hypothetical protein PFICI_04163 [Pestalotiopsis fici W106-1]|uniref:O-methyltransferase C-terminal domain-containing protein n=1 Tax=Pestalotiopsis fici (strain W106-1 / CGMCC3.15140) TaxID=1229662 RepID=W3XJA1_PESFW|nr:uncharacterized protein PFICI_04163 [Pestalotiopsis fici W106-1]ETS86138.1 hypothetical protein PFICI_04163 [Pestalotiopsis fici W106-1]
MAFTRSLPELGQIIANQANAIHDTLNAAGIQQPSFEYGATHYAGPYGRAMEDSRAQLLEALDELRSLIIGPAGHIFFMSFMGPAWTATLHVLYKFELAKNVPMSGSISYGELADRCGLSEAQTRRYIRSAISFRVFDEPIVGMVQHNAASALLVTTTLHDWIGMATEEIGPAALKVADSMQSFPSSSNPAESPFAIAHGSNGDKDLFAIVGSEPDRMTRLANAMEWSMKVPGMEPPYTVNHLGWDQVKQSQRTWCPKVVVDVGGGTGTLCKTILQTYPSVERAIVEDLPDVISQASMQDPNKLDGRLEYHEYDFFSEQTIKDADVYIWRCVLHDWSDSYAVDILRNQVPALKDGARMIFLERCLGAPRPYGHVSDQFDIACDIMMHMCANAQERSREDWEALLAAADKRFEIEFISTPPHSALSIIQVIFRDNLYTGNDKGFDVGSLPDTGSDFDVGNDSLSTVDLDSSSESECNYIHTGMATVEPKDASICSQGVDGSQSTVIGSYVPFSYGEEEDEDEAYAWRYYGFEQDGNTARSSVDEWALIRRDNFFP